MFLRRLVLPWLITLTLLTCLIPAVVNPAPVFAAATGKILFTSLRDGNCEIYKMSDDGSNPVRLTSDPAVDFYPTWSPDGTKIAFSSYRDGNYEVYTMNADGSGVVRLTDNPADDYNPAWSPDGSKIAFVSHRDGNNEIYIMNRDGLNQTRITNDDGWDGSPDWSPDGSRIVFCSGRSGFTEIWCMNADGSDPVNLTNSVAGGQCPAWSPDGTQIVYNTNSDGSHCLFVMNSDGSGKSQILSSEEIAAYPVWSPDGTRIAFESISTDRSEIYVVNADGSGLVKLTNDTGGGPSWAWIRNRAPSITARSATNITGSGAQLNGNLTSLGTAPVVFITFEYGAVSGIYTNKTPTQKLSAAGAVNASLDGLTPNTVYYFKIKAWGNGVAYSQQLRFKTASPDGKIVFSSDRDGILEIYKMNDDGTNQIRLTYTQAQNMFPDWSPDGRKIAFVSNRDRYYNIYTMNANGGTIEKLTSGTGWNSEPDWSPDGTKIAFISYRDGNEQVYTMNADGTGIIRLTDGTEVNCQPSWSPDGTKIAFLSHRDGNNEIYTMNADGTGQVNLTNNTAPDEEPAWSPDGTKIAFISYRDGSKEIYTMNAADGTGIFRLTNNTDLDENPAWSPDGNRIVFDTHRDGNYEIYTMNTSGTEVARLTNNAFSDREPDWARVTARPPSITAGAATNITKSEARLNGNLTSLGAAPAAYVTFQYGTVSGIYPGETPLQKLSASGAISASLSGLLPNTTYYFRIKAWGSGVSYSQQVRFKTALPAGKIVFSSYLNDKWEIYSMYDNGSNRVRLTNTAKECFNPAWSADGKKIAFSSYQDDSPEIYSMKADGSSQTRLTNNSVTDYDPAWSPDGTKISFTSVRDGDDNDEIYVMNSNGANQVRLTYNSGWDTDSAWSPDGARIAFTSRQDGNAEIYIMNSDGSNQTRLTDNPALDFEPDWSPDGSKIVFTSDRDTYVRSIWVMDIDGSNPVRLTAADQGFYQHPAWSPDGSQILCQSSVTIVSPQEEKLLSQSMDGPVGAQYAHIYTMNADGTNMVSISDLQSIYDTEPDWAWVTCRPPAVSASAASNITGSEASLNGQLISLGTAPAVFVTFQYGKTSGVFTKQTAPLPLSSAGAFNVSISGLTPKTTYYFRVKALGNGITYSGVRSFTTHNISAGLTNPEQAEENSDISAEQEDVAAAGISLENAIIGVADLNLPSKSHLPAHCIP
jgi:Tol biopolymer transport system component